MVWWGIKGGWEPRIDPGLNKENIEAWRLGFEYHDNGLVERKK